MNCMFKSIIDDLIMGCLMSDECISEIEKDMERLADESIKMQRNTVLYKLQKGQISPKEAASSITEIYLANQKRPKKI